MSLLAADCIASAVSKSLEHHKEFKITDDCYIRELYPVLKRGRYSLMESTKLWPQSVTLSNDKRLDWRYGRGDRR